MAHICGSMPGVLRRLRAVMLSAVLGGAAAGPPALGQVSFDWATVGDPGNAADTQVMNKGPAADFTTGYGAVDYTYRIAKQQVTNTQYVTFLNAVDPTGANSRKLYEARMTTNNLGAAYTGGIDFNAAAGAGAKYSVKAGQSAYPAVWINWASAARFVNWLENGQGAGGTESGVYDMSVMTGGFSTPPPRAPGAKIFLPSENEWYKAAYYDPTKGGTGGYWPYGTRSDAAPASLPPPGTANSANLGSGVGSGGAALTLAKTGAAFNATLDYLTDVGAYSSATSYYGLSDLDGLVYDWTEATRTSFGNQLPIYRGGAWQYGETYTGASYRNTYSGAGVPSYSWYGFRVAALPDAQPDPVKITGVSVKGSTWNAGYLDRSPFSTVEGATVGWELPDGSAQLANASNVAWNNVDTITIQFDQPIAQPDAAALQLVRGTASGNQLIVPTLAPTLLGDGSVAQWTLPASFAELQRGKYVISIAAEGITNLDGTTILDGDWITGVSTFAQGSGDGEAGGTFNFFFNSLVGDVNGDGIMNAGDLSAIRSALTSPLNTPLALDSSNYRLDIDGLNSLNSADLSKTRAQLTSALGTTLASLPAVTAPPAGDNLSVAAVPEPGGWPLAILGLVFAPLLTRRSVRYALAWRP
jgi:sulfatase modifying factor 1